MREQTLPVLLIGCTGEASCFISSKPLNPYHEFQISEKHLCVQSLVPLVLSLHMASSHILLAALKVSLLTTS
jgi:hypothetical protein